MFGRFVQLGHISLIRPDAPTHYANGMLNDTNISERVAAHKDQIRLVAH